MTPSSPRQTSTVPGVSGDYLGACEEALEPPLEGLRVKPLFGDCGHAESRYHGGEAVASAEGQKSACETPGAGEYGADVRPVSLAEFGAAAGEAVLLCEIPEDALPFREDELRPEGGPPDKKTLPNQGRSHLVRSKYAAASEPLLLEQEVASQVGLEAGASGFVEPHYPHGLGRNIVERQRVVDT